MPRVVWAVLSLLCGWLVYSCLATLRNARAPRDVADDASWSRQIGRAIARRLGIEFEAEHPDRHRLRACVTFFFASCLAGGMIWVTVAQSLGHPWAYRVEETLGEETYPTVIACLLAGVLACAFRDVLVPLLRSAWPAAGPEPSTSWPLQVFATIALLLTVIVIARPALLEKISFLKAGEVEAHFSESASAIQKAPVDFLAVHQGSTIFNWLNFRLVEAAASAPDTQSTNARYVTYVVAGAGLWRARAAQIVFERQLKPLFRYIDCLSKADHLVVVQNNDHFVDFAYDFATLIRKAQSEDAPLWEVQRKTLETIFQDAVDAESDWSREHSAATCGLTPASATDGLTELDKEFGEGRDGDSLWDPYLAAAVADMIGFLEDQRGRAGFLETVMAAERSHDPACLKRCLSPVAGDVNLKYAVVDAKIQSGRPWPLDDVVGDLESALDDLDSILRSSHLKTVAAKSYVRPLDPMRTDLENLWDQTQHVYRRNEIIDLSLGLEAYYQRALAGETLNRRHLAQWTAWLSRLRSILAVVEDAGAKSSPHAMASDDVARWLEARGELDDNPDALEDAVTSVALSIVLLPRQTGSPSSADCAAAREMHEFAAGDVLARLLKRGDYLGSEEKATYRGFLIQIKNRIEAECS